MHRGSCLCGAVQFRLTTPLEHPVACHCAQCRKSSGAFVVSGRVEEASLEIESRESLRWFHSSPDARRGFCATCGSPLFWKNEGSSRISVHLGALDGETGLKLGAHIYCAGRADWDEIADDLPRFDGADDVSDARARPAGQGLRFTVALDGPAAAGKGTIARALAARFGFAHLDTGLLYRATGMKARQAAADFTDADAAFAARALSPLDLKAEGLRSGAAGEAASKVAAIPAVRAALLDFQREFARRAGGAVLDGRDIGTVICPEAEAKLYVTAADETRAARRHAELTGKGEAVSFEQVLEDLRRRDARDAARDQAPMKPAADALLLDTTDLSIDAAIAKAVELVAGRLP